MESLLLSYKGQKAAYTKTKNGAITILLPLELDKEGKSHKNFIQRDSRGWRISSKAITGEEFSNIWVTDSGRICHNSNTQPDITYLEDEINPDKKSDNPIYCRAQDLYRFLRENFEKMAAYDRVDWTPENVIELRKKQLIGYLKLLGYNKVSDIRKKEEPTGEYTALSRVGEKLEHYKGLDFVRRVDLLTGENLAVNIPEFYSGEPCNPEEVLKRYSDEMKQVEDEFQGDLEFVQRRNDYLERARGISPDYFSNMKRKLKPEEWNTYQLSVIKIAKLVMGLNYDILSKEDREGIPDLTGLSQEEVEDRISQFIDDLRFFDTAADIENRYAIKENEEFIGKVDELSDSSVAFQMGELAKSLSELREIASTDNDEKKKKVDSYTKWKNLSKNATKVLIKTPESREE